MAVTNEQQAHIIQRGKERGGPGAAGAVRASDRAAGSRPSAGTAQQPAQGHKPESSLVAAGRKIRATERPFSTWDPIQPSLRPAQRSPFISVGFRQGVDSRGEERPRRAVTDRSGGWTIRAKPLFRLPVLLVPVLPLLCQVNPFPEQTRPAWRPPSTDVHASLPLAVSQLPDSCPFASLFPLGLRVLHQGLLLIFYPQPYKRGFHLQSLDNQDISTAVSFWQRPVLPFFSPTTYFS